MIIGTLKEKLNLADTHLMGTWATTKDESAVYKVFGSMQVSPTLIFKLMRVYEMADLDGSKAPISLDQLFENHVTAKQAKQMLEVLDSSSLSFEDAVVEACDLLYRDVDGKIPLSSRPIRRYEKKQIMGNPDLAKENWQEWIEFLRASVNGGGFRIE